MHMHGRDANIASRRISDDINARLVSSRMPFVSFVYVFVSSCVAWLEFHACFHNTHTAVRISRGSIHVNTRMAEYMYNNLEFYFSWLISFICKFESFFWRWHSFHNAFILWYFQIWEYPLWEKLTIYSSFIKKSQKQLAFLKKYLISFRW